jgi:hypothetical protein
VRTDETLIPRLWNWNRRFGVGASCLDKSAKFFQNWRSRNIFESGGRTCPARSFVSSGPQFQNQRNVRKEEPDMNPIKLRTSVAVCFTCIAVALFSTSLLALTPEQKKALRACTDEYTDNLVWCLEDHPHWDFRKCDEPARYGLQVCIKAAGLQKGTRKPKISTPTPSRPKR